MIQRAAKVVIRSVERYGERLRSLSGWWSGTEDGNGRYQVRGVARGRLRPIPGRWSGTEDGKGRYQIGGVIQRAAEVAIPADNLRYPASVDIIARRKDPETK